MDADKFNSNREEWLSLNNRGLFVEARTFYYENLFDGVIENFVRKTKVEERCDVLFSILGFSPEPIILTQRALLPSVHVIFTTNKESDSDNVITAYLERFLTSSYKIIHLKDETFWSLHDALKGQMRILSASRYVIDVTGGKKSMVASASIFGSKYNCDVVYVDYDQYIPDLRRPMPGTEKLNVVYSAQRDFVKLLDTENLMKSQAAAPSYEIDVDKKNRVTFEMAYDQLKDAIEKKQFVMRNVKLEYKDKDLVLHDRDRYVLKVEYEKLDDYFQRNPKQDDSDKKYFGELNGLEACNWLMRQVISFLRKRMK